MLWLFQSLTNRLKALFVADVASEFESQLLSRQAERRAELLRKAQRYEKEGLNGIALHLRRQAEQITIDKPLAGILPAVQNWQETEVQVLSPPSEKNQPITLPLVGKAVSRKKGR